MGMQASVQKNAMMYIALGVFLILVSIYAIFCVAGVGLNGVKPVRIAGQDVISVPNSPVDLNNNGKLIYTHGTPIGNTELQDPLIGISQKAIKLIRKVEMFQWIELQNSKMEKLDNRVDKETVVYTYQPIWSEALIDSNTFKNKVNYPNPVAMPVDGLKRKVGEAKIGDFILPVELIDLMTNETQVDLSNYDLAQMQSRSKTKITHEGKSIFAGEDINKPAIGDIRISLYVVAPSEVSVIAEQANGNLAPFTLGDKKVAYLLDGRYTAKQIMEMNSWLNPWMFYVGCLILICVGIYFVLKSLDVNEKFYVHVKPFVAKFGFYPVVAVSGFLIWSVAMMLVYLFVNVFVAMLFLILIAGVGFLGYKSVNL